MHYGTFIIGYLAGALGVALAACRLLRWADHTPVEPPTMAQERRGRYPYRTIGAATLLSLSFAGLAACGGSGDGSPAESGMLPIPTDPPSSSAPPPASNGPLPACTAGDQEPVTQCTCPPAYLSGAFCNIPLPNCPVGTTVNSIPVCSCPQGDASGINGQNCTVPVPVDPAPPAPPLTAPPAVTLISSSTSLTAGESATLSWNSAGALGYCQGAAGWPGPSQVDQSGSVNTPDLEQTTTYTLICSNDAGNGIASITITVAASVPPTNGCPVGTTAPPLNCLCPGADLDADNGSCIVPAPLPTFTIALGASASTIVDSAGCPADANGTPCKSTLTVSDSLGDASIDWCSMNGGTPQYASVAWIVGPFASDGPQTFNFSCSGPFNLTASASVTLQVKAPVVPEPDVLMGAYSGNVETLTWTTYSAQGASGCSVRQSDNFGDQVTLSPGGTPSGSASSGFLSPSFEPYTFTLVCAGEPDAGVPTITVSP